MTFFYLSVMNKISKDLFNLSISIILVINRIPYHINLMIVFYLNDVNVIIMTFYLKDVFDEVNSIILIFMANQNFSRIIIMNDESVISISFYFKDVFSKIISIILVTIVD